jgi:hypothetical protein
MEVTREWLDAKLDEALEVLKDVQLNGEGKVYLIDLGLKEREE